MEGSAEGSVERSVEGSAEDLRRICEDLWRICGGSVEDRCMLCGESVEDLWRTVEDPWRICKQLDQTTSPNDLTKRLRQTTTPNNLMTHGLCQMAALMSPNDFTKRLHKRLHQTTSPTTSPNDFTDFTTCLQQSMCSFKQCSIADVMRNSCSVCSAFTVLPAYSCS